MFVADLERPEVEPDDRKHLEGSLRLRRGDALTICDGQGSWRPARWDDDLVVDGPVCFVPEPRWPVAVGVTPVKGTRTEWTLQKLTELGVDRMMILVAERSVVRPDERRASRRLQRYERIAREAAMQSRRVRLPTIEPSRPVGEVVAADADVLLAEPGGPPMPMSARTVLIGPEGGWSPDERSGAAVVGLADGVLRSETAAVAAAMVLTSLRGGWVSPSG